MSTGTDLPTNDVVGQLAESVERGASLLAGGDAPRGPGSGAGRSVRAGPGRSDLMRRSRPHVRRRHRRRPSCSRPHSPPSCAAAPGSISCSRASRCSSTSSAAASSQPLLEAIALADGAELSHFLGQRPVILGAGIFEDDAVVATVGAGGPPEGYVGPADAAGAAAAAPAAPAPVQAEAPAPAPAPSATAAAAPLPGVPLVPLANSVSDEVLARGLALLADVSLEVTAELGRSHLRVSELLALEPGSVIGLEREAGSPVDLLVNGSLFARAEVIVVDGRYAVRITELVGNGVAT